MRVETPVRQYYEDLPFYVKYKACYLYQILINSYSPSSLPLIRNTPFSGDSQSPSDLSVSPLGCQVILDLELKGEYN